MSDSTFSAKKKHHHKRVDIYSTPGASEVIFHDEFNKKYNENLGKKYTSTISPIDDEIVFPVLSELEELKKAVRFANMDIINRIGDKEKLKTNISIWEKRIVEIERNIEKPLLIQTVHDTEKTILSNCNQNIDSKLKEIESKIFILNKKYTNHQITNKEYYETMSHLNEDKRKLLCIKLDTTFGGQNLHTEIQNKQNFTCQHCFKNMKQVYKCPKCSLDLCSDHLSNHSCTKSYKVNKFKNENSSIQSIQTLINKAPKIKKPWWKFW